MIPKVIHYCWFGGNPLPKLALKCIKSWKKYCSDYKIIEWNEDNFNISTAPLYVRQAYESKKWAFVSDYVRLYVMYNYGGIYMDTDVEVIKSLDRFLKNHAFSGFERVESIPTGIMSCEKNFPLFKEFLDYYNDKSFILEDGSFDLTTNVEIITQLCKKYNFISNDKYQVINGFAIYPHDYFCPKDYLTGKVNITENTYTIHHFDGSWQSEEIKKYRKKSVKFKRLFGEKIGGMITGILTNISKEGLIKYIKNRVSILLRRI